MDLLNDKVVDLLFQFLFFLSRYHRPQLNPSETLLDFRYFHPFLCLSVLVYQKALLDDIEFMMYVVGGVVAYAYIILVSSKAYV